MAERVFYTKGFELSPGAIRLSRMKISIIVPVLNAGKTLEACLQAIFDSHDGSFECLVIDDGSTDNSAELAGRFPVNLITPGGEPKGPAFARNYGARQANGECLFFVDADVIIQPDTLTRIRDFLVSHPEYAAIFGSYDILPQDSGLISQYKNLAHHHFHQCANSEASSFWSGCGAMRTDVFRDIGGFDEARYPRPSIEDIELGMRLVQAGYRIYLDKDIQVKHLKRWTLTGLIKTDVIYRGIPWTELIVQENRLPNDLNVNPQQRLSAVLSIGLVGSLFISGLYSNVMLQVLLLILPFITILDWNWQAGKIYYRATGLRLLLTLAAVALLGGSAWAAGFPWLFYASILMALFFLTGQSMSYLGLRLQNGLFGLMILCLIAMYGNLIFSGPLWLAGLIIALAIVIAWYNRGLFAFFAVNRSLPVAVSFFPIQILYYLYSLASFVLGGMIYLARSRQKVHQPPTQNSD